MKKTLLASLAALLLLIPPALWWFCQRPLPALSGREQIAGLKRDVTVRYDAHAVPYIDAREEFDAYVAQGYVTARERMFQMDILRRSARGRLSEVYGAIALPADRLSLTLGIPGLAAAELERLSPPAKQALEAYTRGVNAYLSQNAGRHGLEFTLLGYTPERWELTDSLAILKYIAYQTDESWRLDDFRQRVANKIGEDRAAELFRDNLIGYGLPEKPAGKDKKETDEKQKKQEKLTPVASKSRVQSLLHELAAIGDRAHAFNPPQPGWGSSAFTVPNTRSRSGGALLSCDKHGALTVPAEWFLCSLNASGLHVAGATIPGVPGIYVGRNEDIAWGSAAFKADVQDIYLEQFKSEFDTSYKMGDKWLPAEVQSVSIPVRLGKDVLHKVITTRHGPVLFRNGAAAISLAWSGRLTQKSALEAIYNANHAKDWAQFTSAISQFEDPPQLFVYADRMGNTGCQATGLIPQRTNARQGTMLEIGKDEKNFWKNFLAFDKLPSAFIPAGSTLAGSNMPLIAANQQPAVNNAYPRSPASTILGHQFNPPYRANRLLATITKAKTPIGVGEINILQGDEFSPITGTLAKSLQAAALATNYVDANGLRAIERFLRWDGQLRTNSPEASVYEAYLQTWQRRIIEPALGRDMATEYLQRWSMWKPFAERIIKDRPAQFLPPEERTYDTFFLTTLTQAMKALKITFDDPELRKWNWGGIHTVTFRHVSPHITPLFRYFAAGPVNVGGSGETLNSSDVVYDPLSLRYNAQSGPTQRMIVDMFDRDKFYQALSTGQSGHIFSPHREDQIKAWQKVDLAPVAFSPEQLKRQAKQILILESKYGL